MFARAARCAPIDTTTKRCDLLIPPSPDQQLRQPTAAHGSPRQHLCDSTLTGTSNPGIVSERSRLSLNRSRHLLVPVSARHSFSESTTGFCFKAFNSSGHDRTGQDRTGLAPCTTSREAHPVHGSLHDAGSRIRERRLKQTTVAGCPSKYRSWAYRVWVSRKHSEVRATRPSHFLLVHSMLHAPRSTPAIDRGPSSLRCTGNIEQRSLRSGPPLDGTPAAYVRWLLISIVAAGPFTRCRCESVFETRRYERFTAFTFVGASGPMFCRATWNCAFAALPFQA